MSKVYTVDIGDRKRTSKSSFLKRGSKKHTRRDRRKPKKGRRKIFTFCLALILILSAVGFYIYKASTECEGDSCNPVFKSIKATIEPKLKQEDGLTNILVVGIDTREGNSGLMNTDTIIIATIDYENKTTVLTSIPRDLWVRYQLPNGNYAASKVNSAYSNGEWQEEGKGIETLRGVVETITGQPIHYYVKVTLRGFIDIIDTIDGIDINIPSYYKDAYPASELPAELQASCIPYYHDGKYCLFEFQEGWQHMDGQTALIYARCRLLAQRGDFDRAQKQQRVINAVKEKILSSDTYLDPKKLWEIYGIVQENIETEDLTINDLRAALNLRTEIDTDKIGNVVLDPMLGNVIGKYIYVGDSTIGRGYHIVVRDESYLPIQELLKHIRKYPLIYNEAPKVSIYNASGNPELEKDWALQLESDNPLLLFQQTNKIIANPDNKYKGIKIYKFTQDEKPSTEEFLKQYFEVKEIITEVDDGTLAYHGEDYVIIIGVKKSTSEPENNE